MQRPRSKVDFSTSRRTVGCLGCLGCKHTSCGLAPRDVGLVLFRIHSYMTMIQQVEATIYQHPFLSSALALRVLLTTWRRIQVGCCRRTHRLKWYDLHYPLLAADKNSAKFGYSRLSSTIRSTSAALVHASFRLVSPS